MLTSTDSAASAKFGRATHLRCLSRSESQFVAACPWDAAWGLQRNATRESATKFPFFPGLGWHRTSSGRRCRCPGLWSTVRIDGASSNIETVSEDARTDHVSHVACRKRATRELDRLVRCAELWASQRGRCSRVRFGVAAIRLRQPLNFWKHDRTHRHCHRHNLGSTMIRHSPATSPGARRPPAGAPPDVRATDSPAPNSGGAPNISARRYDTSSRRAPTRLTTSFLFSDYYSPGLHHPHHVPLLLHPRGH